MKKNIIRQIVLLSLLWASGGLHAQNDNSRSIGGIEFETPDLDFTINDDPYEPGFAGGDKSAFYDRNLGYVYVDVGKTDSRKNVYYKWEVLDVPDAGNVEFSDIYSSKTTVKLDKPGVYVLRCIQMSKYGRKSECIYVNVSSKVNLISVRRKDICYYNTSAILKHDFEYETDPPGLEDYINLLPPDVIYGNNIDELWPMFVHDVEFEAMNEDGGFDKSDVKCQLPVIDDQTRVSYSQIKERYESGEPFPTIVEENVEPMKEAVGAMNRMFCLSNPNYLLPPVFEEIIMIGENGPSVMRLSGNVSKGLEVYGFIQSVASKFEKFKNVPDLSPVSFEPQSDFQDMGFRMDCDNGDIIPKIYYIGTHSVSLVYNKDFDVPKLSLPKLGGVYAEIDVGLNVKFENNDINKELNPTADKLVIPLDINFLGGIRIGVRFISADLLSGSVAAHVDMKADADINFTTMLKDDCCNDCWELADDPFDIKEFDAKVILNVKRTFMSFTYTDESFTLINYNSINGLMSDLSD